MRMLGDYEYQETTAYFKTSIKEGVVRKGGWVVKSVETNRSAVKAQFCVKEERSSWRMKSALGDGWEMNCSVRKLMGGLDPNVQFRIVGRRRRKPKSERCPG